VDEKTDTDSPAKRRLTSFVRERRQVGSTGLNGRTPALVLAAYVVLTVILTYPVALNIPTEPAGSTDVYEYMWELWWAKRSVIDLRTSPADVTALYHPFGTNHPILCSDAYLMWTSLPLVLLFSPTVANNIHFLSSYVLTGFTTYLLCYSLTKNRGASFLGGAIFAFSPFRSDRAAHGVISMALTYWLPLYVLFFFRLLAKPRLRNAALCGIYLGFAVLSSFLHLAHFVIPFTVVFLAYQLFASRAALCSLRFLRGLGLVLIVTSIMILPFYLPVIKAGIEGELEYFLKFGILSHSAAVLNFVVPPSYQLLVRSVEPLQEAVEELLPGRYYVVYLGVVPLALALCGLSDKRVRIWVIMALVSGVLALGPLLHVTRDLVEYSVAGRTGYVVLPAALLTKLPLYEWARSPARFAELTIFAIAMLATYGAVVLYGIVRGRVARLGLIGALLILTLLDYTLFFPFPAQNVPVPEFYRTVSHSRDEYGILDVGTGRCNHEGMYFQITHQRPIVRGFIYRYPSDTQYYQKFIEQLVQPEPDMVNGDRFVPILRQLEVEYVVLHKRSSATEEELGPFLMHELGSPVYEDAQIAAFAIPTRGIEQVGDIPLFLIGEQWHPTELIDGVPSRWMVNDGTLYVMVEEEGPHQLALTAHSFGDPRHLQIFVSEERIEEYHVGGMQSYVTSAFMPKSREWTPMSYHVAEGCEVPIEAIDGQNDARCSSMLFQQLGAPAVQSEMQ
jgi:hypothetical protein